MNEYEVFNQWLFDGSRTSEIPQKEVFLKYNSPISNNRIISMFLLYGQLNHYLDKYFNNVGVFYLEKEDLFKFIKKCIIDFRVRRNNLSFFSSKKNSDLFQALRKKFPTLKGCDINLLSSIIDREDEDSKKSIYDSLGLLKPEKAKAIKNLKKKKEEGIQIKIKSFISEHFSIIRG